MSAHEHYSKIPLSKRELAHVYRQLYYASQAKIHQMIPGCTPHDKFSIQIQNIISRDLETTFELAKYALAVDGADMDNRSVSVNRLLSIEPTEEVVPFDAELNQELRDLVELVEKETTEVTRLRRELPQQARDAYEQLVVATDEQVTAIVKETEVENGGNGENGENGGGSSKENDTIDELVKSMEEDTLPNAENIRSKFSESIECLYSLKQELPQLQGHFWNLTETVDSLMNVYEQSKNEPVIYE